MMLTIESPALETERTCSAPGTPITAVSIGYETRCSTSVAARPGASVTTTTWLLVRSGKASTGRSR